MADAATAAALITGRDTGKMGDGNRYELWQVFNAEPCTGSNIVDSIVDLNTNFRGFDITSFKYFGLWVTTGGTGAPNILIGLLESPDNTAANFVTPNTGGTVVAAMTTSPNLYSLSPTPMTRMRIRLRGNAGNGAASVTVTAYLFMQG